MFAKLRPGQEMSRQIFPSHKRLPIFLLFDCTKTENSPAALQTGRAQPQVCAEAAVRGPARLWLSCDFKGHREDQCQQAECQHVTVGRGVCKSKGRTGVRSGNAQHRVRENTVCSDFAEFSVSLGQQGRAFCLDSLTSQHHNQTKSRHPWRKGFLAERCN